MPNVIFVPGFGGSELTWDFAFGLGHRKVWLDHISFALGGFQVLRLAADGLLPATPGQQPLTPGPPLGAYYGLICDFLRGQGWDTYSPRLDWRLSISASVPPLVALIRRVTKTEPVSIVAHSRGGLVTGAAMNALVGTNELARVKQVITLGTPWGGSYGAIGLLVGSGATSRALAGLLAVSTGGLTWALASEVVRQLAVSWPGSYELLPDPARAEAVGDGRVIDLYTPRTWSDSGVGVNATHLAAARARWLPLPQVPGPQKWTCVVGTGVPTAGPLVTLSRLGDPRNIPEGLDGDGTVPTWSATLPTKAEVRVPCTHNALVSDPAALAVVQAVLSS